MRTKLQCGTRIKVRLYPLDGSEMWEAGKIGRVRSFMLPMPEGYSPVTFADGSRLLVHKDSFRVIDNHA